MKSLLLGRKNCIWANLWSLGKLLPRAVKKEVWTHWMLDFIQSYKGNGEVMGKTLKTHLNLQGIAVGRYGMQECFNHTLAHIPCVCVCSNKFVSIDNTFNLK